MKRNRKNSKQVAANNIAADLNPAAEPETLVVDGTIDTPTVPLKPKTKKESLTDTAAITGLKVCEVGGLFQIYTARRHQDGSFVREGDTKGAGTTAQEASELLVAMKLEVLVKHKKEDYFIFGGDIEAATHFHTQYGSKVGEMVVADAVEAPAPKAKAKPRKKVAA